MAVMDKMSKRPLRVAIITGQLGKGGAEMWLHNFLQAADWSRFTFRVILLNPGGYWLEPIRALGIEVTELPERTESISSRLIHIIRLLRDFRCDVCHSWNFYTTPYAAVSGRIARVPVLVGFLQDMPEYVMQGMGRFRSKLIFRSVHAFIVNSQTGKKRAEALGIKTNHMFVVRNVVRVPKNPDQKVSRQFVREQWDTPETVPLVGTVARLDPKKNHTMFVDVIARLKASYPDLSALLVGDGPTRERIEAHIRQRAVETRLSITGIRNDVNLILPAFDVFLSTSVSEGLPHSIEEAMAAGVPVVATDVGGIRELIDDGENGFIVPSDDVEAMVERVKMLLDSPELRRRIGMAGREKMRREFTVEKMVDTLQNVYIEMLRRKGYEL